MIFKGNILYAFDKGVGRKGKEGQVRSRSRSMYLLSTFLAALGNGLLAQASSKSKNDIVLGFSAFNGSLSPPERVIGSLATAVAE